jgi:cell division septation protein DedD
VVENAKTVDAANDFKKQLQRPCWVISITSVAKESIAVARTKELRTAGNTADYYWIPDYVSGGNRYFKVFVGPFTTKADAQNYLSSHELTADAYVLKVE